MSDKVFLVDAMAYIFRAFYSQGDTRAPDGRPAGACFGFLDFLIRLVARENPGHIAAVFDAGPKTFRNEIFPDYKANRGETPPDLLPQFELCERLAEALGMPVFKQPDFEADDVLATLTKICAAAGREVVIISGDKDLAQLVDPHVSVIDPGRNRRFTTRTMERHFGVRPDQMVDYLALIGDSSDNVPGVRGVGPKTAVPLLTELESLDGIYANLDRVAELPVRGAKTLAAKLTDGRDMAYLSRRLVELRRDLPLNCALTDLAYAGAERGACEELFGELGFDNFLNFVSRWRKS